MRRLTPAGVSTMMVVVVGLLVTAYFAKLMRAEDSRGPGSPPTSTVEFRAVPTAAGPLEPGTVITSAHLSTARVRVDGLVPDVLLQEQSVLGRTVKQRIAAGSSLRASQLYPPGEGPQPVVARGMRAVSIPVPRGLATMNGLVKAGQYVDVYLTPRADAGGDSRLRNGLTLTLFRGVRLLSVAPDATADEASSAVTLELTPEQATVLILAREKGSLALSYNPEGKGESGVALKNRDRATLDEILGVTSSAVPNPPEASATGHPQPTATITTEVFKGTARSTRQFDVTTKVDATPATATPTNTWSNAPLWTRKTPAPRMPNRKVPNPDRSNRDPERMVILPDHASIN
jgi:pilus assembly protein CpaB